MGKASSKKIVHAAVNWLLFALALTGIALAQEPQCAGPNCPYDSSQSSRTGTDQSSPIVPAVPDQQGNGSPTLINEGWPTTVPTIPSVQSGQGQSGNPRTSAICPGPQCPVMLPEEKTEFQKFVFTTTGEKLSIYGRSLFDRVPSTFAPVDHIPVPADYVIGPGDEMLIRAWGQIDVNARVYVDRNGQIYLPRVGTINVAGIRYDQVTDYLKNQISRVFKNFNLNVTLGQLRSIQIFVVGQARRPGSYTVSSLSTLVNALFASGGPSANGSMRHIQLRREGKVVTEFDVYDLLAKGDKSKDSPLLPGDVIYIPAVAHQVAVMGSVNLPGIYELDDATTVAEQIEIAGGLSTTADGSRVIVERIDDRSTRNVVELKLDQQGMAQRLKDGDMVRVFPISPRVEGGVALRGSVALPGRYPFKPGMKVADLIPSREAVITREYWMRQASLSRSDLGWLNPEYKRNQRTTTTDYGDQVRSSDAQENMTSPVEEDEDAHDRNRPIDPMQQQLPQQGQTPLIYKTQREREREREERRTDYGWSDGPVPSDKTKIIRNTAEINWDYAVIQRLNPQDLTSQLVTFNLGRAISDHNSADNVALMAGDVITIFSQADLAVPAEKRTKFVWIEGEVNAAGVYRVQPGETLRDLVARAGGITPKAYLFATDFRRNSTRIEQQKQYEKMLDDMEQDIRAKARVVAASFAQDERAAGQAELEEERQVVNRLRQVRPTGRIVLELKPEDGAVSVLPDIPLEDGDRLTIPAKPATVGVVGAVYSPSSFLFENGSTVSKYLNFAGGGTRNADKGRVFVIRANGSVVSSQMHRSIWAGGFGGTKMFPGDAIVMPEKIKTSNTLRGIRDWSQVFAQFALGVAALKTIAP